MHKGNSIFLKCIKMSCVGMAMHYSDVMTMAVQLCIERRSDTYILKTIMPMKRLLLKSTSP